MWEDVIAWSFTEVLFTDITFRSIYIVSIYTNNIWKVNVKSCPLRLLFADSRKQSWKKTFEFFLNVFTESSEFSDKK